MKNAYDLGATQYASYHRYGKPVIYHPNAAADGKEAKADATREARLRLDLRAAKGPFAVEWYRAGDGSALDGGTVEGGEQRDLHWTGADVVLRLLKK